MPSNNFKKKTLSWVLVILWATTIFILSSIPNLKTNLGFWDLILRKFAHIFEFAVLTLLLWYAFKNYKLSKSKTLIYSGILAYFYAISDEFHQLFIWARAGRLIDTLIDIVGIIITIILINLIGYNKKND